MCGSVVPESDPCQHGYSISDTVDISAEDGRRYRTDTSYAGFPCVAMALRDDSCEICDSRFAKLDKLAVILGTEGEGLRQETIMHSDYTVKIPMTHGVDSLNVAAASAVAFWQLAGIFI